MGVIVVREPYASPAFCLEVPRINIGHVPQELTTVDLCSILSSQASVPGRTAVRPYADYARSKADRGRTPITFIRCPPPDIWRSSSSGYSPPVERRSLKHR
jgi:hypothetical protein